MLVALCNPTGHSLAAWLPISLLCSHQHWVFFVIFFEEAAALVTGAAGAAFAGRAAVLTPAGTARWGQGSIY